MGIVRICVIATAALLMSGCANIAQKEAEISPGMNRQTVRAIMGLPMTRSIDGTREAWQYGNIVGFAQRAYTPSGFLVDESSA